MNRQFSFPRSVTRQQVIDSLAALGINAHDVGGFRMDFKTLYVETPNYKEDDLIVRKSVEIPVEDS